MSLAFFMFLSGVSLATPIPINNYSFENPSVSPGGWTQGQGIPGWDTNNCYNSGEWCGVISGYGTASEGNNADWVQYIGWISQDLNATLQPDYTYTLSVSVGHRSGFPLDPEIQLLAGGNVLIDKILADPEKPVDGAYSIITLTYQSGQNVTPNQYLTINLMNTGSSGVWSQPHFDNVTLDASPSPPIPEPSTFLLLGAGLVGVGFLRKRFKK